MANKRGGGRVKGFQKNLGGGKSSLKGYIQKDEHNSAI